MLLLAKKGLPAKNGHELNMTARKKWTVAKYGSKPKITHVQKRLLTIRGYHTNNTSLNHESENFA